MKSIIDEYVTYNTETGAALRARIIPLFEYGELSEEAKTRALHDWMDDREPDPYYFADCYESEIWACVRDLEQSITGARVSWSYNRWYSADFDCEWSIKDIDWISPDEMNPATDNGCCYSMDLCSAWNAHARRLNAIARMYGYMVNLQMDGYPANEWENNGEECNRAFYNRLEDMAAKLYDLWIEELEAACQDVQNEIETLLRGEWEWYTGEEYARLEFEDESTQGGECRTIDMSGRVYYSDDRRWYTIDGEEYEQSDINHECVSIMKAS